MSEIPKPSRTETTMDDLLNALAGANDDGTLDDLGKPLNICDHCKKEISPGERCWMTTLTEITADSKVFFPSAYDIKYPFRLFCSDKCCRDFWTAIVEGEKT